MLKWINLFIFIMVCSLSNANAVSLDLAVGETFLKQAGDNTWYENPYDHTLNLHSPSLRIGGTGLVRDNLRWRAGYMYVGKASSTALAKASDNAYFQNKPYPLSHWYGKGDIQGLYGLVEPEYERWGYTFFVDVGAIVTRPTWTMTIPDWVPCTDGSTCIMPGSPQYLQVKHNAKLQTDVMFGAGVRKNNWYFAISKIPTDAKNDQYPAIYTGYSWNVLMGYQF